MNNESGTCLDTHATFAIVIKAGECTVRTKYCGAYKCFHKANRRGYVENEAPVPKAAIKSFILKYTIIFSAHNIKSTKNGYV